MCGAYHSKRKPKWNTRKVTTMAGRIERRTPLKRYTPVRKKRPTLRRGEPTKEEKEAIRLAVYERCGGKCELHLDKDCSGDSVLPFAGSVFERWHLVHRRAKRRFGWREDPATGQKHFGGCYSCHIVAVHSQGKKIEAED